MSQEETKVQKIKSQTHIHTEYSLNDSALSVSKLVDKLSEYGCESAVMMNHGNMIGSYEFMKKAKEKGINGIPGVEGYIQEDDDIYGRQHLGLVSKDFVGFLANGRIVTEANKRIDDSNFPRMSLSILKKYCGEGAMGHGHVICQTACIAGPISQRLLYNKKLEHSVDKLRKNQSEYKNPTDKAYLSLNEKLDAADREIKNMTDLKNDLDKLSKKSFKKRETSLKTLSGDAYTEALEKLNADKQKSEDAKEKVVVLKSEILSQKSKRREINNAIKSYQKDFSRYEVIEEKINAIEMKMKSDTALYNEALEYAKTLLEIFGEGNLYMEIQNHGLEDEAYAYNLSISIAKNLGIPLVASNDIHMATNSTDDIRARQIMRSLRFNKWESLSPDFGEYYIKTDDELSEMLGRVFDKADVDEAMKNISVLCSKCKIEIPKAEHYPEYITPDGSTPGEYLEKMAREGIKYRYLGTWDKEKEDRLVYELNTIENMGYSSYICIVADFIKWTKAYGKKDGVGYTVGPGRGSGAGSIVLFLVTITAIDPIKYGLVFERFLNVERVSMPDIDTDFAEEVRVAAINYVKSIYGEDGVCQINTISTQAAKAAIKNCARLLGSAKFDNIKTFYSLGCQIANTVPKELKMTISKCYTLLTDKFGSNPDAMQIISDAMLVEGTAVGFGTHAAGVVISNNRDVAAYVPLRYDTEKRQWVSQCDMVEVEENGLLKMDFLGLKSLDVMTECIRMIAKRRGKKIDLEEIPFESEVFEKIFALGKTFAIFQFESSGMRNMLKQFCPSSIFDLILLVAAYRPGPMDSLPKIIAVKKGREKIKYGIKQLAHILDDTYGSIIYQEQVMQIFRDLAGYSYGLSDIVRRAMSKKKDYVIAAERKSFIYGDAERGIKGCVANGIDETEANKLYDSMVDFAKYAFNKSHAAAYAIVAYQTAWLKLHYPAEFFSAVFSNLESKDKPKIPALINECKSLGVEVVLPEINKSGVRFTVNNEEQIVYGLGGINGISKSCENIVEERKLNGHFLSFKDFLIRILPDKTTAENLIKAGAMDCFNSNRKALLKTYENLTKDIKAYNDARKAIEKAKECGVDYSKSEQSMKDARIRINEYLIPSSIIEVKKERLDEEHNMLRAYISEHPLADYVKVKRSDITDIDNIELGSRVSVIGMVKNLRVVARKKDGAALSFFDFEDLTGEIGVNCFVKQHKSFGHMLEDGAVLIITGDVVEDEDANGSVDDEDEDKVLKITVDSIKTVKRSLSPIIIHIPDMLFYQKKVFPLLIANKSNTDSGREFIVHDRLLNEFRRGIFPVAESFATKTIEGASIEIS